MRFYQLLLITGVIILVVLGLNTSNHGINNLTRADRHGVLALDYDNGNIKIDTMGASHTYSLDRLQDNLSALKDKSSRIFIEVRDYLKSIWTIFECVFLYN
jgi:hypothetical protein